MLMPRKRNRPEKLFKDQYSDEEVLYVFRKHPIVMRRGLIYFMLAVLAGTIPSFIKPELSYFYLGIGAGILLGCLLMLPSWIYWYFSVFIVTNKRFIQMTQAGFFKRGFSDIGLDHIQSINYEIVGVQETLLGFGTIVVQTYLGDMVIHDVHHPEKTTKTLSHILIEYGDMHGRAEKQQKTSRKK